MRKFLLFLIPGCVLIGSLVFAGKIGLQYGTKFFKRGKDSINRLHKEIFAVEDKVDQLAFKVLSNNKSIADLKNEIKMNLVAEMGSDGLIVYPKANHVYQNRQGVADIKFKVKPLDSKVVVTLFNHRNEAIQSATLKGKFREDLIEHKFSDVSGGMYRLCIMNKRSLPICTRVGVGEVFILAGQSNVVSPANEHDKYFSQTGQVFVTDVGLEFSDDGKQILTSEDRPTFYNISWLYAGDELVRKLKVPIGFVNVAAGNTNTMQWVPGSRLHKQLLKALKNNDARAVLWVQGESDIHEKFLFEKSYSNMKAMITEAKKVKDLDWIIGISSSYGPHSSILSKEFVPVGMAQRKLIDDGLAVKGPNTNILRMRSDYLEGHLNKGGGRRAEFGGQGLEVHGLLWSNMLSQYLKQGQTISQM